MTSKRFFAYTSIIFSASLCTALVFVSRSNLQNLFANIDNSSGQYSLTISDYNGNSSQTYYTTNGNPLVFEYRDCTANEEGLALVTSDSVITCITEIHGITSLLVTTNQSTDDIYVHFTVFKESGSFDFLTTPNKEAIIDVPSIGFAIYFEGPDFIITGIKFTYTCM